MFLSRLFFPTLITFNILLCQSIFAQNTKWEPVQGHIMTKWAKDVSPDHVLPEYPRPQMRRAEWMNLNGLWEFDTLQSDIIPFDKKLPGTILVPFPIESALSGVMKKSEHIIYRRTFIVPKSWLGSHILLHFGAVDWETTVFVNGKEIGIHKGGYDPFTFDITDILHPTGKQELILKVFDPTNTGAQPCGKQVNKPEGIFYTSITGIWQTVWIEPVNKSYIHDIKLTPDIDHSTISIMPKGNFNDAGFKIKAGIFDGKNLIAGEKTVAGKPLVIKIPGEKLWSPDNPFLYELTLSLIKNGKNIDIIKSYFGMRKISIRKDKKGITRILLNNKFVFLEGPLDQGFWPDGLYTAPTDEALKHDIQVMKNFGFNMVRKHIKVEPQRWYYWCDKLGLIVLQDMPSAYPIGYEKRRTTQTDSEFQSELERMIESHWNHPSIVMWNVFNEGWGQHNTEELTKFVKDIDPSRLVDDASGGIDKNVGDVIDIHSYTGPDSPKPEANRAAVLGEFGGLGLPIKGHIWDNKSWGYKNMLNRNEFLKYYKKLYEKVWLLESDPGLSAAVYTQLTDVETEVNGLMSYDRKIIKIDPKIACLINQNEISALPKQTIPDSLCYHVK
jgi:beta-galactosidase/beta-glucuronidase